MSNGDIIISLIFIMALIGLGLGLYVVLFHTDDETTEMKYIYYNSSSNITDWTYPSGVSCIDVMLLASDPQPLVLTAACKEEINKGRNITPSIRPEGNYMNEVSSNITIENANAGGWGIVEGESK